jgi:hypothetical protein
VSPSGACGFESRPRHSKPVTDGSLLALVSLE